MWYIGCCVMMPDKKDLGHKQKKKRRSPSLSEQKKEEEEEKLFKANTVPSLHAVQADGKTLHQHIAVEELKVYDLMQKVALAAQKLPTGGTLSAADLRFVLDLERVVFAIAVLVDPGADRGAGPPRPHAGHPLDRPVLPRAP